MKEESFTSNQVTAIIESLRGEFRAVAEVVVPLREDMIEVKERLTKVEMELIQVKDAVHIAIPSLTKRVERLESKAGI